MMYGAGDSPYPLTESINTMEDILLSHLTDLLHAAHKHSTNKAKLKLDDLRAAMRADVYAKQLGRVDHLQLMDAQIKKAKQNLADPAANPMSIARTEKANAKASAAAAASVSYGGSYVPAGRGGGEGSDAGAGDEDYDGNNDDHRGRGSQPPPDEDGQPVKKKRKYKPRDKKDKGKQRAD